MYWCLVRSIYIAMQSNVKLNVELAILTYFRTALDIATEAIVAHIHVYIL